MNQVLEWFQGLCMEVGGSKLAAGLMAEQVYLCQGVWSLLVDAFVHRAVESLFVSSICMKMFDGRDKVGFDSGMGTVETQPKGTSLRIVGVGECFSRAEDLTDDVKFMNGPDTNVRISNAIAMSLAATSKDEGESEDDKDEDDEDDDNEEDFGEEEGEEDVSSEDGGEENNGVDEPEGGGGDEEEEDEDDDANDNNENDGSDDDEEEDDDDDEVVEEEDDHAEGDEGEDDEGEDKDGKEEDEEDEEDEESLHPSKKRKK